MNESKTTQRKFLGQSFQETHAQKTLKVMSQSDVDQTPTKQEFADEHVKVVDGLLTTTGNKRKRSSLTYSHMEPHEGTTEEEWRITRNIELTQEAKPYFPIIQRNYKEVSDQQHT